MKFTEPCCDKCWHSHDKICPKFIECISTGPLCHESSACSHMRKNSLQNTPECPQDKTIIYIGSGTCGLGAGAKQTKNAIEAYLAKNNLEASLVEVGCIGYCVAEPIVDIRLPGKGRVSYQNITANEVENLLDSTLKQKNMNLKNVMGQFREKAVEPYAAIPFLDEHPFFKPQLRWVLNNCGVIDPSSLSEYLANGGYQALAKTLREKTPEEVVASIESSGLRGRGGGGFLTGRKWKFALNTPASQKYFICNADEGDPGAFMDRALIEGDPHKVLEGIAIGAYAIGASEAYFYIRAEYPLAIERLKNAIAQAQELGVLGNNILDSGFNLKVHIKMGAGAFVCGEETALMHSIEGKRGMPRPRPPFPAASGLFGKPTIINNVETLANVPVILTMGAQEFSKVGSKTSKGTKVFALSGKVVNTGLVEVKMGTKIKDIIFDIGQGIPFGKKFKAVQFGGPSGGCVPHSQLDIEVDYESLLAVGAMMGSGGMVVMDEDTCMVDVAKFFMDFIQRESCGKCIPCREGTKQMLSIFEAITRGTRSEKEFGALERMQAVMRLHELASIIKETSLCGLGQSAPNPILSTLRWFSDEYDAHIYDRKCPSKVCGDLLNYEINEATCIGCTICKKKCPAEAIVGAQKSAHHIVKDKCIGCGNCAQICPKKAIFVS